jgi:hypothetical protein
MQEVCKSETKRVEEMRRVEIRIFFIMIKVRCKKMQAQIWHGISNKKDFAFEFLAKQSLEKNLFRLIANSSFQA